jgi:hypothetical protein
MSGVRTERAKGLFPIFYSLLFFLAAGLSIVMLETDKNLQTNFGAVSSGYFIHWYAVLAMAAADLAGAAILLVLRSRTAVKLGVIGSALLALALLGAIFTYSQVGFASAMQFAQYLFGVTYFGGDIRYLYDVLLGVDLGTAVVGGVALALTREARHPSEPGGDSTATSG